MRHFFRDGEGLSCGQSDRVIKLTSYQDPIDKNKLLLSLGRYRSDAREGEDRGSRRTTFGLASPLLRPYITDSSRIQYLFNTSESRIVDEKVIKRCSGGNETPKLVRSRYGSDWSFSAYSLPIGCLSVGLQPRNNQRTTEEQANKEQGNTKPSPEKEQGTSRDHIENKQGISKASVWSFNTLLIHCYYLAHTWGILRAYTGGADPIGIRHIYRKGIVPFVQSLCKAIGLHKTYINPTLYLHNSWIIGMLKGRQGSGLPLNFLRTVYEPETHIKGTGNKHKRYMPDTCLTHVQHNNDTCLTHERHMNDTIKSTKKLPERYCKGTGKVLNSGGKGTEEVLESYQIGTKHLHATSKSVVGLDRDDGELEKGGGAISFDSSAFKEHCGAQIAKNVSLGVMRKMRAQRGLNEVGNKMLNILPQAGSGSYFFSAKKYAKNSSLKTFDTVLVHPTAIVKNFVGDKVIECTLSKEVAHPKAMYRFAAILMIFMLFSSLVGVQAVAQVQPGSVLVGEVRSAADGAIIDGATVTDGKKTVHTDTKGRFSIAVDKPHGSLKIKYIGYKEQSVAYDKITTLIRVNLEVDQTQIQEVEVVSTGFFSVPKERATGSFTHVNNELLSRSVGSNVIDRLKDVAPGITFNQTKIGKSNFYKEPSISIRGRSTIRGNAEPLVILDNFPYEGKIEDINPEDIESVTILQDAAAASIWGARAGNGVIVLKSKQGHREQPMQVNWRSDYSISAKPDLYYAPTIPMDEFIEVERFLFNKNAWNPYINQGYSYITPAIELLKQHRDKKLMDMELEEALDVLKGQDVRRDLEKYFYRPSSLRKTFLSFNGGGKRNTYYFSAGYDQNLSDRVGGENQRISINMRNSFELWKDKLKMDVGLQFAKGMDVLSRQVSAGYNVLYDRLVDDVGNPLSIGGGNKFRQSYIDTAGNGLLKDWNYRPVEEFGMNPAKTSNLNYQLSTGLEYKALDWVSFSGKYQYGSGASEINWLWQAESFQMRNLYNQFTKINHAAGTATSAIPEGGQFNVTHSTYAQHNGRAQLAVDKDWNEHRFNMIMGAEVNKRQTFRNVQETMLGYQPATETYTPMDLTARYPQYHVTSLGNLLVPPTQNQREGTDNRNVLLFANASYSYDRRYTATFSVRKDRANIFGVEANKKGKPFMSAGMLWNLHEETFMQLPWLQKLSLRGTLGTMGNVSTASAYLTSQVGASVNSDNGRKFQSIVTAPNPLLSWEKVRMANVGMDFSIFNSKLSVSIERYYRSSTDLLSNNPMNPSSGISTLYGNWSAMKSSGWDISLNSRLRYVDFSWTGNLIFSHIKDRVTDYYEKPTNDRLYLTSSIGEYPIEGKPLNTIYSLPYAGLDSKGDPMGYLDGELSTDYANIYSNTSLSDYIYHGRATPSTFGSLRNSFAYKGVELSFMLSYHLGYYFRQKAFSSSSLYSLTGYGSAVFQSDYTQRWQQVGDEATTRVPRATYPANGNRESFYSMVEDHVQPGDHIRFRDIRLSYSFPSLKNGLIRNLQVYGYVDKVGLLWAANDSGFDPLAIPDTGLTHPTPRTYALGLNLKF